jgi:class 3 adenylate cyclase
VTHATEVRKTVTVVFCDVTGSTSLGERLDPEAVRRVIGRYFDEIAAVIERHGGTVEKFIGDAVLAVFGVPLVHEDDALRAVRAAAEMREALRTLNVELERDRGVTLAMRIGVNTGPVVAGDPSTAQPFVTGDAVNVAARLEQAADPGQVLLGETTLRLVRRAVTTEPVSPLALKGKGEPVLAEALVDVAPVPPDRVRRRDAPMVGRKPELDALREALRDATRGRCCVRATVVGAPGVGKSRLVDEFAGAHDNAVVVVRGRCLSYGDGITYWPVVEILTAVARIEQTDGPDVVRSKIGAVLASIADAPIVLERLAELLGISGATAAPEETHWAVRRLLEALARTGPVTAVLEDLHWAEPALLDLIEHVTTLARDASIVLLCTARPEFLEDRPDWIEDGPAAVTIPLEPLSPDQSDELVANLIGPELPAEARSILAAAEGNPLFLEQLVGMLTDEGHLLRNQDGSGWMVTGDLSTLSVPPTIQGVLEARLERLPPPEWGVVERGSVEGRTFHRASVLALAEDTASADLGETFRSLERRGLIEPAPPALGGGEAFRFRHAMIRDAAYARSVKATRADLHERHARWLERTAGERLAEFEDVLAYHLEQATRLTADLGPLDEGARAVAGEAARRLASSGRRAAGRGDARAAAGLFERALALMEPDDPARPEHLVRLAERLTETGEGDRGMELLDEARAAAAGVGDTRLEIRAKLARTTLRYQNDPEGAGEEFVRLAAEGIPILEELGDDETLARAWKGHGEVALMRADPVDMTQAYERAAHHAERAGDRAALADALSWLSLIGLWDMTPPEGVIRRAQDLRARSPDDRSLEAMTLMSEGYSLAMLGRTDEGRALHRRGHDILLELGLRIKAGAMQDSASRIETLAGDLAAAEHELRQGIDSLASMGELGYLSTQAAMLGEVLYRRGRLDEAEEMTHVSERSAASDDLISQVQLRGVRAKVLARRGESAAAVALAEEARAISNPMDFWDLRSECLRDLAEVYRLVGRPEDAARALERALAIIEKKGVLPLIEVVGVQLAEFRATN